MDVNKGFIVEAQCECVVDMSPEAHCKHVGRVMYGVFVVGCFLFNDPFEHISLIWSLPVKGCKV